MAAPTVSIYGYGRFGKLWAQILAQDFKVKVFSKRGLQPAEVEPDIEICDEKEIFQCDVLFFCVAISAFKEVLKNCVPHFRKETLFFDTCSVKTFPARWMKDYLPQKSKIIATHPMFGPDSYQQMAGKLPIVMCNINADKDVFNEWRDYFISKSMNVEHMTPGEHDEIIAYSQGITHYTGRVLADLKLEPTLIDTHGYKLLVQIIEQTCNDSEQLFFDLLYFNPFTKQMLGRLHSSLDKIRAALRENEKNIAAK